MINKIYAYSFFLFESFLKKKDIYYLNILKKKFKKIGIGFGLGKDYSVLNAKYIEIGNGFWASHRFRLEAIDSYENQSFSPKIVIGNNVTFNPDCHIGCIDIIQIGDNCLFASKVFISDHNHGDLTKEFIKIPPGKRPLTSKGGIIIGNNVWVGENVSILSGVTIGENSIIAANAVVTKDVLPNTVVGGVPAKVIKEIG